MSGKKVSLCPKQNTMTYFHSRLELDDDTMLEDNFPEHDEDLRVNDRTLLKQAEVNASHEISAPIFHEEYCIVVPVIKKRSYGIASNIAFPMICLGTIVLLKFFVTLALKFDRRFWKMTILTQMLLGLTVHGHPKKSIERLALAGLLFFAIVASVFVYNALSYMQMDYEKEVKFSALHELMEHKIKLQANRYDLIGSSKYLIITDTLGREHKVIFEHWDKRKFCLKSLVRLQNVGCYMSLVKARLSVFNNNMKSGKKVAKIMDDCPRTFTSRLMLKKGSMYLRPVNNLLKNFIETGIPEKISQLNMMNFILHDRYLNANDEDEKLKDVPLNINFWLKFAGIGVSIASFVLYVELAQARRERRRKLLRASNIE
uniref:Ionotropic glutamate receptor C-terminal domain-containing protein n=1 Tax=Trichogramma kaykai TaxID=54128 RepID=A0ABD2W999_9HYME